jgi:tetratricopeptide (TPR) repeat protein
MPGRFANLEFEDHGSHAPQGRTGASTAGLEIRTARDLLHAARGEEEWGRFEPALRLYTRALQDDRALVPAWVGQVQMLVQLGEFHEGRIWSDKALQLFRNNGDLLSAKAQALARLSDVDGALAASDAALQSPESSPWRWIARAEVLLVRRQRFVEECLQKAVAEPLAQWFDRVLIARMLLYHDRATSAVAYVQEALRLQPGHGYLWYLLGECQCRLAMGTAAQGSYGRCLELKPDFRPARLALDELACGGWSRFLKGLFRRCRK